MIERMHLKILREVDRQGSLTAAAEQLHLTQSALSHTMKKLESQLGMPLWEKQGRNIQLTQAGLYLLRESKRLLPQLERVDERLSHYASGEEGVLPIGMECHPCYQWLLKSVPPFLAQWSGVDIDVKQRFQFGGLAALCQHEIDILITPDPVVHKDLLFTPVFDYEQVLVVSKSHALYGQKTITPQALVDQVLYTYPVEASRLDIFTHFLLPDNCRPKQHKHVEATEMMLHMVAANRGVAALPQWLVDEYQSTMPIGSVRLGEGGIQKKIHAGMRKHEIPSPFAQAFLDLMLGPV